MAFLSSLAFTRRTSRRVKTPTLLQMEAVECGAAALGIILGYYGRYCTLEELRSACGVSRDGSKAVNIVRAARAYGLIAKGYRKSAEQLLDETLPVITFWNNNHFLVVEGFGRNKVYLNDPALGPRTVGWHEFQASYSNVVLCFQPSPDFKKGGHKPSVYRSLAKRLKETGSALGYAVLAGLALVIPGLAIPVFTKIFVDEYLVDGLEYWVKPLLLAMLITALLKAVLTWLQKKALLRLEIKMALKMSGQFFWHVLRLPVDFLTQRFAGDVANRLGINDRLAHLLSGELATTCLNLFSIVFFAALMASYDIVLTLVVILIGLLNLAALQYVSHKRKDLNLRMIQERGKLIGTSMHGLQMIESIKASGAEFDFFSRWAGYQAKTIEVQQQFARYSYFLAAVPPLLTTVNSSLVIGLGGLLIMKGAITMGMLVAFQSFMHSYISPFNSLVGLGGELQEIDGDMRRLDDVLNYSLDPQWLREPTTWEQTDLPPKLSGMVELRDVTFGYNHLEPPLIEKFNMKLEPGSRVALVGSSGSGKSTVVKLICGLYEPWAGEVLLDGRPRQEIPRVLLTRSLSMVDQSILLFEGTVRDNICMWDDTIAEEDMIQAGIDACIHEELAARAGGYGCMVEEGGSNFSGGQRQRLEIARALATNPSILVLDEATSALDPVTEKLIDNHLRRRGCTCIIVAHRLSTIRDCDEIIVLHRGKVVQRGQHEELIKEEGLYAKLIQSE